MRIKIYYQAEVEYFDIEKSETVKKRCNIVHQIDQSTLQTIELDFEPIDNSHKE